MRRARGRAEVALPDNSGGKEDGLMVRSEHPDPQFKRASYTCLNGQWEFEWGKDGSKKNAALAGTVEVPFCPGSALSGVPADAAQTDCMYSREIEVTEKDLAGRLVVHFGAADHRAEVYLNGTPVGAHEGGYTPFAAEIGGAAKAGKNRLTVFIHDDVRENVPSGKQTPKQESFGCFYSKVTGIWQTVWLERTPRSYIKSIRFYPDVARACVHAAVACEGEGTVRIEVSYKGRPVGSAEGAAGQTLTVMLGETHLWEAGCGRLYDVTVFFGEDTVESYFGLRDVRYEGKKFLLNGKSVFQRFVLDQGYYEDGLYTAPSVAAMQRDIAIAQALGFNGARLHQKVFEPRYLYECDRAGYLVWGEYASWGVEYGDLRAKAVFLREWAEAVERDFNHPCIVTWCPLNETWESLNDGKTVRDRRFVDAVYAATKALDATRPCIDVSGGYHGTSTDVADFHCYAGYEGLREHMLRAEAGAPDFPKMYLLGEGTKYNGEPLNLSEFGGVSLGGMKAEQTCCILEQDGWGYEAVRDEEAFLRYYEKTVAFLLSCGRLSGFCYTQLYDVEQEQNGLYDYARRPKFSAAGMARIRKANAAAAAIEQE